MKFTVRYGIDARQWYRSEAVFVAAGAALSVASSRTIPTDWIWIPDGVIEFDAVEEVQICDDRGVVLSGNGSGGWWDNAQKTVKDPLAFLHLKAQPADDNILDGGELLRMKALRQAVIDEITWHNNEAAHHREAAAECTDEDYTAEHWGHTLDAHSHDKAAERLRAILNGAVPPAPEAAS
jgi:hypothetical protein